MLYGIVGLPGEAAQGLQAFLASAGNRLTCQPRTDASSVCLLTDGTDLAEAALINGAARATEDAPVRYHEQEAAAQAARRGLWSSLPPPPAALSHPIVRDTATLVADRQTYALDGVKGLGQPFSGQLQGYIAANGDAVNCQPQPASGKYLCLLNDGTDLAKVALVNGAAMVGPDAPDAYRLQQREALASQRGYWLHPAPEVVVAATVTTVAQPVCCALVPGDDGSDGVAYVGGAPTAVIEGQTVFLVFAVGAGWGYWDHWHHWRGAPDRYWRHMERYHPDGHGLRGYEHPPMAGPGGAHPGTGGTRPGGVPQTAMTGHPGAPGMAAGAHPAMAPGMAAGGHPATAPGMVSGAHPGVAPGMAPGGHPGMASGMHPNMPPQAQPAMAAHPSAGGGGFIRPTPVAAPVRQAPPPPPQHQQQQNTGGGGGTRHH